MEAKRADRKQKLHRRKEKNERTAGGTIVPTTWGSSYSGTRPLESPSHTASFPQERAYVVNGAKNRTTTHDMTTSIFGSQSDASIPPNQPTNHIPQSHTHPLVSRETNDEEEQIPDRPSFRTPGIDDHSGAPSAWSARCVYAVVVILRRLVGARPAFVLSRVCVLR